MGRLIDVDKFKAVNGMKDDCADCDKELRGKSKACEVNRVYTKMDFCGWIDDAPTVDAVPVRHGRWIDKNGVWYCSGCNKQSIDDYNFCPHCGMDMRWE